MVMARDGFFFLLTTKYLILHWKNMKKDAENPDFAEMGHFIIAMTSRSDVWPACGRRAAVRFYLSLWLVRVCVIKRIHHLVFSGGRKIPTRGPTVPVGNEACRVSH